MTDTSVHLSPLKVETRLCCWIRVCMNEITRATQTYHVINFYAICYFFYDILSGAFSGSKQTNRRRHCLCLVECCLFLGCNKLIIALSDYRANPLSSSNSIGHKGRQRKGENYEQEAFSNIQMVFFAGKKAFTIFCFLIANGRMCRVNQMFREFMNFLIKIVW